MNCHDSRFPKNLQNESIKHLMLMFCVEKVIPELISLVKPHGRFPRKLPCDMSRVAKCIDNGPMEGFWGILKREWYYGKRFTDKASLVAMIEDLSENWPAFPKENLWQPWLVTRDFLSSSCFLFHCLLDGMRFIFSQPLHTCKLLNRHDRNEAFSCDLSLEN